MESLGNNVWLSIINIIYIIHSTEDLEQMANLVLKQLCWIIPYDNAIMLFAMDDRQPPRRPVAINFEEKYITQFLANYKKYDCTFGLKLGGSSIVYKESDVVDQRIWKQSNFYKEFCEPNKIGYVLQMVLCYRNQFLGNVILFRQYGTINAIDFNDRDIFILNLLKEHLTIGIARLEKKKIEYEEEETENKQDAINQCIQRYHLTAREGEILGLLIQGNSTGQICDKLFMTVNTLKKHISNMYKKLEITSRSQLQQVVYKEK